MRKFIYGSAVLAIFSISIIVFQISCQKEASAQTDVNTGLRQLNKIVFIKFDYPLNREDGIYIANYDGTNVQKVNIPLHPKGFGKAFLSPDGKTLFYQTGTEPVSIYSCNIDGSNHKLLLGDGINDFWLQSVH